MRPQPVARADGGLAALPRAAALDAKTMVKMSVIRGRHAQLLAGALYNVAALGSWIGQIWAGATNLPWPEPFPLWLRLLIVAPFALVIDLGGVATMAIADWRRSEGESALFWRILSFVWLGLAVGINIIGHLDLPLLAVGFGFLGAGAFAVAYGHIEARRRDALKAAGLLPRDKPRYGDDIRKSEPDAVRLAERFYYEDGLDKWAALDAARESIRSSRHSAALAAYLKKQMTETHGGDQTLPGLIAGAIRFDQLAELVMAQVDLHAWAGHIGSQLSPPTTDFDDPGDYDTGAGTVPSHMIANAPLDVIRRIPNQQGHYDLWRWLWAQMLANPEMDPATFAHRFDIKPRQEQSIRKAGSMRLLDFPQTPAARLVHAAAAAAPVDLSDIAHRPRPFAADNDPAEPEPADTAAPAAASGELVSTAGTVR
ncbi:hypothetical protein AB0B66_10380 [Catellatospora sp. NPDC049111]|uniref:hypothetical protein n=1 Tax=Catellatospora sp. NPDC049111 TaxID=3155271 RepID=UPI0033C2EB30